MKILHVTDFGIGGAGIAAYRLHTALLKQGVDSRMLVRRGGPNDPFASEVGGQRSAVGEQRVKGRVGVWACGRCCIQRLMVRARGWLGAKITKVIGMKGCSLNIMPTGLHKVLNASDADVIHLHWINNEMISIKEIAKITKPIVWTLHDCWPLLGVEHHSDADYWQSSEFRQRTEDGRERPEVRDQGSGVTDKLSEMGNTFLSDFKPKTLNTKLFRAINHWIFRKKQRAWNNLNVHFIAPSQWMAVQLRQSKLFGSALVSVIPNGLDTNIFRLRDKNVCRRRLGLPPDKKLILFGAHNPLDPNKGGDLLEMALLHLPENVGQNVELVVFGMDGSCDIAGFQTHWLGAVKSEEGMAILYNTADVLCVPSRKESFGQTASEALACGIPVVAFRTTGLTDIIDHEENGYMAEPFDAGDLAQGLRWILGRREEDRGQVVAGRGLISATDNQQPNSDRLSNNGREKAQRCYSSSHVAREYTLLYENVLKVDGLS